MTADLQKLCEEAMAEAKSTDAPVTKPLLVKGVWFGQVVALPDGSLDTSGIEGVDDDMIIKPFHRKGAVISLRQFTNNAMNHHHGMQSAERFGDGVDADNDGITDELTQGDMTAITIFQAALPVPGQVMPVDAAAKDAAEQGKEKFSTVGCAVCHVPQLRLESPVFTEPNPFNPTGNLRVSPVFQPFSMDLTEDGPGPHLKTEPDGSVLVPAFADLKRHDMGEALNNEPLVQDGIPTEEWLTGKLWGMATEPPYLHHGRAALISEGILMHGGDAQESRDAFASLPTSEQDAVVEFLQTLQVLPPDASEVLAEASLAQPGQVGSRAVAWGLIGGFIVSVSVLSLTGLWWRRSPRPPPASDSNAHGRRRTVDNRRY